MPDEHCPQSPCGLSVDSPARFYAKHVSEAGTAVLPSALETTAVSPSRVGRAGEGCGEPHEVRRGVAPWGTCPPPFGGLLISLSLRRQRPMLRPHFFVQAGSCMRLLRRCIRSSGSRRDKDMEQDNLPCKSSKNVV